MNKRITLVIDAPEAEIGFFREEWNIDLLAKQLNAVDRNISANVFEGHLEDAPDSWAYILYTDNERLPDRARSASVKQRLSKTIGAETTMFVAADFAEANGLLGALDIAGAYPNDAASFLNVKTQVASRLKWPFSHVSPNKTYGRTSPALKMPLAKLIVTYLQAALTTNADLH